MKKFWKRTEGFTLVELVVVIAILGTLAGVGTVGYSGYIKKANTAADKQLLSAVNTAFATACIANNTDINNVSAAAVIWENGKVAGISVPASYNEAFVNFYGDNVNSVFKVFAGLCFEPVTHTFVEMDASYTALQELLIAAYGPEIAAVQGSIYHTIGYGVLANNIDNAAGMMAGIVIDNPSSGFNALLNSDANQNTLLSYFESEDDLAALGQQKVAQLKNDPAYAGKSEEELFDIALTQMLANTAVLTAAQNSSAVNSAFITSMGNGTAVSALKASTDGGNATSDTVAQAAFAYAMYTSYKASIGETPTGNVNLTDVYATLQTTEFQDYMKNNSAADQAGYFGAMDLIVGSANNADSNTINDILLNGFNNSNLVGVMQNVTASNVSSAN